MIVYIDEKKNTINKFDNTLGKIISNQTIQVTNNWIQEKPEEGHWETITFYPETGGKDVKWIIDAPEQGHWESIFGDGLEHPDYKISMPNYVDKTQGFQDSLEIITVHLYTSEEKQTMEEQQNKAIEKQEKQQKFLETGEQRLSNNEQAVNDLTLSMAEMLGA